MTKPPAVSVATAPHYTWGSACDGWRLADGETLSVIEERMPPGTAEEWHVHDRARQFFYVLDGQATMRTTAGATEIPAGAGVEIAPGVAHQITNASSGPVRFLVISTPSTRNDRRGATAVSYE
jgi:mannose-6-phosphate isomerase-like protein (cupin superfamily)